LLKGVTVPNPKTKAMGTKLSEREGKGRWGNEVDRRGLTLVRFPSVDFPCKGRGDVVLDCVEAGEGGDEEHPVRENTALAVGEIWRDEGRKGREV